MKKKAISKLFENEGLIIGRLSNQLIEDLVYQDIVTLFEKYGVILFKGFDTKSEKLTNITDNILIFVFRQVFSLWDFFVFLIKDYEVCRWLIQ